MKCTHLIVRRYISACSALEKPYLPSQFVLMEYCKTIEHRKCPFYLREIICTDHAESSRTTRSTSLQKSFCRNRKGGRINAVESGHVG
jgi:hypothetical protein